MRLFVALKLEPELREEFAAVQRHLRAADPGRDWRWTDVSRMHLTLVFLGEVAPARVEAIGAAIAAAVEGAEAPVLAAGRVGVFPGGRDPRVLWVGVRESGDRLVRLQRAVEAALVPLGFPAESRPFQPHVTLARRREAAGRRRQDPQLPAASPRGRGARALPHPALGLFCSEQTPAGPRHTAVRRWSLALGA